MAKKSKDISFYQAIGRRKEAVALVRLYITGKDKTATLKGNKINQGTVVINGKSMAEIFPSLVDQKIIVNPLELTDNANRFAISIKTNGGGKHGQLDAIVHGIARALRVINSDDYSPILKEHGLLTRDPRAKERRKVGTGGKARRQKQSPKR